MVACLEKSDENAKFHQIVDFLSTCSINYALIVSPTIYASYIEQFWNTATSKIINYVKQIHAIVNGKAVVISESSVRSDLLFNDEDGVTCLTNDEIFKNLALMGYEQLSTKLTFQKTHFEQILLSPTTYQRKRKTQKCRRTKKETDVPQTSVPLDHGADEAIHKEEGMDTGGSPRRQDTMGRRQFSTAGVTISTVEPRTPLTTTMVFDDEDVTMAMAQTLIKMKEQKAKEKGVSITDVEDSSQIVRPVRSITTLQPLLTNDPKDKGKGVLVEEEPERQRQEDDTNAALAKEFDEIQARIDVDHELAVKLTHEEKKQLAAAKAKAIRNKPPTKTQVRNRMITYLKHMGKYTHQQLKNKTYKEIQRLYEKDKRWIDDFQPMDTQAIKDSEKKVCISSTASGVK
ncbi:hypothetical protein Tco_1174162 [Tanacetum coccineum]